MAGRDRGVPGYANRPLSLVVDTSALMALVRDEPGADVVESAIGNATASAVIFAECLGKLALLGYDPVGVERRLLKGGLLIAPVDGASVGGVVSLYALARKNVSLADRFCLALGLERNWPIMTADRPWADLGLPVELRFIR